MKENAFTLANQWGQDTYLDEADRQNIKELLSDPEKNETEIIDRFYQDSTRPICCSPLA